MVKVAILNSFNCQVPVIESHETAVCFNWFEDHLLDLDMDGV